MTLDRMLSFDELYAAGRDPQRPDDRTGPDPQRRADARRAHEGLVTLADVIPERVEWLWRGRLPLGKVVMLDGDPGVGKSVVTIDLAARVSTGTPMPGDDSRAAPADVVLLSAEDGTADTIRPRLDAAQGDPSRVHVFEHRLVLDEQEAAGTRPPVLPTDCDELEAIVQEKGARLVVIDPLMAFLDGHVNAHRDQDVRRVLHRLKLLAERTGAALMVVRHLNKSGGTNPIYRGGGSIGLIGAARVGLMAAVDPDDESGALRLLAVTKSNVGREPATLAYRVVGDELHACARVEWLGPTDHRAGDLLVDNEQRSAAAEAEAFLAELLADGSVAARDAHVQAREAGIARRTLDRARKRLGVASHREGFGKGGTQIWELPCTPTPHSGEHGRAVDADGGPDSTASEADQPLRGAGPCSPSALVDFACLAGGEHGDAGAVVAADEAAEWTL